MQDVRFHLDAALAGLLACADRDVANRLHALLAPDCVWRLARPIGDLRGADAIAAGWLLPVRRAIPAVSYRADILIGGASRTGSGDWVARLGHFVGNLEQPLFGIAPSAKLVFLRCGEFYRLQDGRVTDAYILPDLLDLLRQTGRPAVPLQLGTEMLFPAPATQDGRLPSAPGRSDASAKLVESMLGDLHTFDPQTFASAGQTSADKSGADKSGAGGYWHPDMLWYGPCGIGANFSYAGFQRDHRIPFLTAFPDRKGGNHFARFGDGDYVCSGGWPSMTMTHRGPYLGIPATGRALTLRVMDFWRVQDGTIRENWVLLDLPDLMAQMGHPVI